MPYYVNAKFEFRVLKIQLSYIIIYEFKQIIIIISFGVHKIMKTHFSIAEIKTTMKYLESLFDVVRLVDPIETAILTIKNGKIHREKYSCYKVWDKKNRCEICSSICALTAQCPKTKHEFLSNNIFYVVSQPIYIILTEKEIVKAVLEIISRTSDHLLETPIQQQNFFALLNETQRKLYEDELTGVYNRRYLNEFLFLQHKNSKIPEKLTIIFMDLQNFKLINDTYGHLIGDKLLKNIAQTLAANVRTQDSVIRFGGDEFIIILTNCTEDHIQYKIDKLKARLYAICYDTKSNLHITANFGYSHSNKFILSDAMLQTMIQKADSMMYNEKKLAKKSLNSTFI